MIYLDLETTGLSITNDRIVQIATIKGTEEKKILINPGIRIPAEATAIHGITDEMVKDAPTFKNVARSFLDYLGNEDLAGYNSNSYDIPLLMEEFIRVGMELDMSVRRTSDVYTNECIINPRNLAAVYKRLTGDVLEDAHDALSDTRATKIIHEIQLEDYSKLIAEEEEGIEYVDFTRKIYKNEDGHYCWSFGKNKDKIISADRSYCNWVLKGDFTHQVKEIVRTCLYE